jgi:hypothetical protein
MKPFDAEGLQKFLRKKTAIYGVPTMFFFAELAHPDFKQYDLSEQGIMAGSLCPSD